MLYLYKMLYINIALKNTETGPRPSQVKFRQASIHQLKDVAGLPGVLHHGDGPTLDHRDHGIFHRHGDGYQPSGWKNDVKFDGL